MGGVLSAFLIELVLVGLAWGFSYVWEWWHEGERHTGIVVAVEEHDDENPKVTIRDPETELERSVYPDLWRPEVGDTGTAVVMRSDDSKVATPTQLAFYLVLWIMTVLAAAAWALLCAACAIGAWLDRPTRPRSQ